MNESTEAPRIIAFSVCERAQWAITSDGKLWLRSFISYVSGEKPYGWGKWEEMPSDDAPWNKK